MLNEHSLTELKNNAKYKMTETDDDLLFCIEDFEYDTFAPFLRVVNRVTH